MEAVGPGVALGVAMSVGVGVGAEGAAGSVGVGVGAERAAGSVGVGVGEERAAGSVGVGVGAETPPVKLIESRYNVPCLRVRLTKATPLMCVALALRADKGIVYTFQLPAAGSPP